MGDGVVDIVTKHILIGGQGKEVGIDAASKQAENSFVDAIEDEPGIREKTQADTGYEDRGGG